MTPAPQKKKWKRWLVIILIFYVLAGLILYFIQDKFLLHPVPLPPDYNYSFNIPFKEKNIDINNDKKLSIIQFTVPDSASRGVVLYFHGNKGNIARYAPFAPVFTRNNYEVWMIDYPGFGKTTGTISEKAMEQDAIQLYKLARSHYAKDSIIIYGKSLGTGPACFLASRSDCKKLILETPYYSIPALMQAYIPVYPMKIMANYHFPNFQYLKKAEVPVSIFHGTKDNVIPYSQAKKLVNILPNSSELITINEGKHLDLYSFPLYQHKMDSLLQ